ncbi:unnamed protein product, partial [Closterium sp. NIES-53]
MQGDKNLITFAGDHNSHRPNFFHSALSPSHPASLRSPPSFAPFPHTQGDKNLITFAGDHNSHRPNFFYDSAAIFLHNVLQPPPIQEPPASSLYSHIPGESDAQQPVPRAGASGCGSAAAAAAAIGGGAAAGAGRSTSADAPPSAAELNPPQTTYQRPPPVAEPAEELLSSEELARLMAQFAASMPPGEELAPGLEADYDEDE